MHEDGSGGAVICADARQPDQTTQDILLQYVDEDGNETDARYFGSEFEDDIRVAAMDEQQNVFVAYRQAASLYPRSASMRLLSVDADKELADDVAIEIENGGFLDLIPLGNGEVVVIAYANIAGQNRSEVIKVATDGSIAWQKQFTNAEDGVQYLTAGLYHEGLLYLADYIGYKFITLDVANGNLSGALTFPDTVLFNVFSPFVIYQDALWILSTASVSQLIENSSGYELANSYEVDEDRIENARLRATGQWEYLNNDGQLKSFDLTTAQFSTLAEVEFTEFVPISEKTCNVILEEGELITGVRRYRWYSCQS